MEAFGCYFNRKMFYLNAPFHILNTLIDLIHPIVLFKNIRLLTNTIMILAKLYFFHYLVRLTDLSKIMRFLS